ncbi:hypothetical protein SGFS_031020 [Streptomyces graminofaciens]|uniref:Uncharacterized protein n=1 Tax=Streptomyces graminofaciens TaxID=68212 RepID=A0ABN5VEP0_9ACTN|nr:hypothetical protein SGFS_031020 [Streptomyces graminofaciens]
MAESVVLALDVGTGAVLSASGSRGAARRGSVGAAAGDGRARSQPTGQFVDYLLVCHYVLRSGILIPPCENIQSGGEGAQSGEGALDCAGAGVKTPSTER